ncbi:large subunit GTPase 1 homolog isoform X2 [Xenia sp. Carnegie-2017]|uniref:large subunit GTPase 1 homolog isoform X2 n=1 Tax=Xenia sp. Carnegie-2017 TaxID=2897299 RepID=UPI001F03CDEC|nr:large subunit GTPase 1 homolog isoform X2 [Xenia sp. Carnegie-2017]
MGKKHKKELGRAILKDRTKGNKPESWLHTSELPEHEKLNTKSVTEESALDEFLATAELAGTEFAAEKLNIKVYNSNNRGGLPSKEDERRIHKIQEEHKEFLQIPRRPKWNATTTAEQLDQIEKEEFLAWRRTLAEIEANDDLIITPFERNLEFWRQLWRVIERSDVVVQIVDARNPLLFRCEDLENYVKEVNKNKVNVLLINKADFLTQAQRESWAAFFKSVNVKAIFWSAVFETERLKKLNAFLKDEEGNGGHSFEANLHIQQLEDDNISEESENSDTVDEEDVDVEFPAMQKKSTDNLGNESLRNDLVENAALQINDVRKNIDKKDFDDETMEPKNCVKNDVRSLPTKFSRESVKEAEYLDCSNSSETVDIDDEIEGKDLLKTIEKCNDVLHIAGRNADFYTSGHLLTGDELLAYCQWLHHDINDQQVVVKDIKEHQTVIGLVGYPNVGKSSTINAILQSKKVPVSSTPGRTKHFQTLMVDKTICLCDCPGLVFPSFVSTKAEMVISGILPIDQLRDHVQPIALVCERIPRYIFETVYGINLNKPEEWEEQERSPYPEELLNAYGESRSFITRQGRSDAPRSARYILKDYVNGKLLYCHPPPNIDEKEYQVSFTADVKTVKKRPLISNKKQSNNGNAVDNDFFQQSEVNSHVTATTGTHEYRRLLQIAKDDPNMMVVGKPWKKHGNKNKREKLRRLKPNDY